MAYDSPITFSFPDPALFSFPPSSAPPFIPPPPPASISSAPPVAIPDHVYRALLDPRVPITIAAVYTVAAKALNAHNRSTGKKPWAISRTRAFRAFVVLHNVFLAVYSAWTWWGMYGAMRRAVVSPLGPAGLAGFADSMCRLHGPPGLGQAVFFSGEAGSASASGSWQTLSAAAGAIVGEPLRTDPGRIWNEGLAFYGWIFYLSKFYEVLDTFIILAKGKFSSTLQTYHHAGAMLCMWAGMRYMSPPIWMFVFFNSGIHAMMYTYYTVTAFSIRVPVFVKRTLTSLQISQFLVGASYAMVHSFVSYTIPESAIPRAPAAPVASPSAGSGPTALPTFLDGLRQAFLGAINGGAPEAAPAVPEQSAAAPEGGAVVVPCIVSGGATLAIWLNVVYLAPLTYLFVKFFITSYLRRSSAEQARSKQMLNGGADGAGHDDMSASSGVGGLPDRRLSNVALAEKAGWDAAKEVEREVYGESQEAAVETEDEGENVVDRSRLTVNGHAAGSRRANGRVTRSRP